MAVQAPTIDTAKWGGVPALDVSASYDAASGEGAVFIVNRSETDALVTDVVWQDGKTLTVTGGWQLAGTDPKAANTWEEPNNITAQAIQAPAVEDGKATLQLPPLSFTVLTTKAA